VTLPSILSRQRDVLRSSASFRFLFGSTLVSGLGTWIAVVALSLDVFERTHHSGLWVAALLIADFLPAVAIGLLLGPLVDRLSRKGLLVGADVVRVAAFVLLVVAVRPWQIVALAFLAGVASGFARPAAYAALPNLVSADEAAVSRCGRSLHVGRGLHDGTRSDPRFTGSDGASPAAPRPRAPGPAETVLHRRPAAAQAWRDRAYPRYHVAV
jgi:hypothetical protein